MRFAILLASIASIALASSVRRPAIRHVSHLQDAQWTSRDKTLKHDSHLEIRFDTASGGVRLDLQPNLDLLLHGQDSHFVVEDEVGDLVGREPIDGTLYHVYKGHTMRSDAHDTTILGDARILVHSTEPLLFEGSFMLHEVTYHVQLGHVYHAMSADDDHQLDLPTDSMVLWSDTDREYRLAKRGADLAWYDDFDADFCPSDRPEFNLFQNIDNMIEKRQLSGDTGTSYLTQAQLTSTIGQKAGCPVQREVAVVGAAADCNFVGSFNSTASARASIIAAFNTASNVYETAFNIALGLGQIVISEATCPVTAAAASPWNTPCDSTTTIGDRLSQFSTWRGRQSDTFAAWSLITTCSTDAEIGVAWFGTLCNANTTNQTDSVVSGTNVVAADSSGGSYWETLAHELGHNFGASHDCTSSTCGGSTACCPLSSSTCSANGQYIMNPTASSSANGFSPCTVGQVCSNMLNKVITTSCLSSNQNVSLADGAASCGNGIVEDGEECDCGGTAGCGGNKCCNPTTCKFNTGAVCDSDISACCTSSCQFSPANTTCRASTGSCDPAETCTGTSGICPSDAFAPNGQSCGNDLQCASGQCTSRKLQCQQQMNGSSGPCDDYQCALTCFVGSTCFIANQYFITGTTCGNGGFCQTGTCNEGSVGHQIETWFDRNRNWLIPVLAVIGALITAVVLYCWITTCMQKRNRVVKQQQPPPEMIYTPQILPSQQGSHYWNSQYGETAGWRPQQYSAPQYPQRAYH